MMANKSNSDIQLFLVGLFFIFMSIWPYYIDVRLPGLGGINPQRIVLIIITAVFLLDIAANKRSFKWHIKAFRSDSAFFLLFFAFCLLRILSSLNSGELQSIVVAFYDVLSSFVIFLVVSRLAEKTERRDKLIKLIIVSGLAVLITALIEAFTKKNYFIGFAYAENRRVIESLNTDILRDGRYRIRGIFENPLTLVQYLMIYLPFLFIAYKYFRWKAFSIIVFAITLILVMLTWSRSGAIITAIIVFLYLLHTVRSKITRKLMALMIGLIVIVAGLTFFDSIGDFLSSPARSAQLVNGYLAIKESPLLGYGVANQIGWVIYNVSLTNPDSLPMWEANALTTDNRFLTIALESGIPSLACFISLLVILIKRGIKNNSFLRRNKRRDYYSQMPTILAIIGGIMVMTILSIYTVLPFLFICLGLMYANMRRSEVKQYE